jgi:hypothetical protein
VSMIAMIVTAIMTTKAITTAKSRHRLEHFV